jgi:hypothetical protein
MTKRNPSQRKINIEETHLLSILFVQKIGDLDYPYLDPYDELGLMFLNLDNKYKKIIELIDQKILTKEYLTLLSNADRALKVNLLLSQTQRQKLLAGTTASQLRNIPEYTKLMLANAFNIIQSEKGQDRAALKAEYLRGGMGILMSQETMAYLENRLPLNAYLAVKNSDFINTLTDLPPVFAIDEARAYPENVLRFNRELMEKLFFQSSIGEPLAAGHYHLHSFHNGPHDYENYSNNQLDNAARAGSILFVASMTLYLVFYVRSLVKQGDFDGIFTTKVYPEVEYLRSLPRSEDRTVFLARLEVTRFQQCLDVDPILRERYQSKFSTYKDYVSGRCTFTYTPIPSILDPLTVTGTNLSNSSTWFHTYCYSQMEEFVLSCEEINKDPYDPESGLSLNPVDANFEIKIERAFPEFINPFIEEVRQVLATYNANRFFSPTAASNSRRSNPNQGIDVSDEEMARVYMRNQRS